MRTRGRWLTDLLGLHGREAVAADDPAAWMSDALGVIRYVSLGLAAALYFASPRISLLALDAVTVGLLFAEARLAHGLLTLHRDTRRLTGVIGGETLAVGLLLLPSGGLRSPFMWYAVNPLLAASAYLPLQYSWGMVGLLASVVLGGTYVMTGSVALVAEAVKERSWLFLMMLLLVLAGQVYSRLVARLGEAYRQLRRSHERLSASVYHRERVYQALERVTEQGSAEQVAGLLAEYAGLLCRGDWAVCVLQEAGEQEVPGRTVVRSWPSGEEGEAALLAQELSWLWDVRDVCDQGWPLQVTVAGGLGLAVPVGGAGEVYGALAVGRAEDHGSEDGVDDWRTLQFLAELGSVVMERIQTERLWGRLLVNEEQQRIAGEIHDGVAQYLFGITCALHELKQETVRLGVPELGGRLEEVARVAGVAARELRLAVHRTAEAAAREAPFVEGLRSYLDNLAAMNGIQVRLHAEGREDALSPALRRGLYRIIREAVGNAVRHGRCRGIEVVMSLSPRATWVEVRDDGCGFDSQLPAGAGGLGLRNMRALAEAFDGELEVSSQCGCGTVVRCVVPRREAQREGSPA